MDAGKPHHLPMKGPEEADALAEARRQLAVLQRRIQVEEALERVRARSMAMHRSEELAEVALVLFQQVKALDIDTWSCGFNIWRPGEAASTSWMSPPTGDIQPPFRMPHDLDPVFQRILAAREAETLWVEEKEGDALAAHYAYLLSLPGVREIAEPIMEAGFSLPTHQIFHAAYFEQGYLMFITLAPCPEAWDIFRRFARVFEQTYTRFLDLKKAEEQAREAQMEAALERVRAKAMAMHSSEDLAATISVVFQELKALHITPMRCGVGLIDETRRCELFTSTTTDQGESLDLVATIQLEEHPVYEAIFDHWERQQEHHLVLQGEDLISYYRRLKPELDVPDWQTDGIQYGHFYYFPEGGLYAWSKQDFEEEERHVFRKFTTVLGLTYRRYLDLKEAEAQAREAQIEAALERVRARSLAMHQSDELREVIAVVFAEMEGLGFAPSVCAIGLFDATTRGSVWWQSDETRSNLPGRYHVPYLDHPWYTDLFDAWQRREPYFVFELSGASKKQLDVLFFKETDFKNLPDATKEMMRASEHFVSCYASMSHGVLEVVTDEALPDDKADILQRVAKVIDLTYTRVDDLQKAEARAVEAARTASLDRVRAEISSMRRPEDLQRITPLMWRELTALGVPFFRCGVFIMDEDARQIQTYLANPQGETLATLRIPYESAETTSETVAHWRAQQVYTEQWDREQFVAWMRTIQEQGLLASTERYQGADVPPEQLALQFVPFTQGMLYVGSRAPLADDQIDLVQMLADAFAVAYARYEDFRLLEAAKAKVEATLYELKATQTQLIQQEKMASLGQLTAGIAHEIKNPLNFVNNFAEINEELADELRDALANGEDVADLLDDLEQNARVIAEHGKRADGIVRAMMAHARGTSGQREPTDLNVLLEEYVGLAYHGKRAQQVGFTCEIEQDYDEAVGTVMMIPQDIGRVILNLLGNAFDAVHERALAANGDYTPTVTVSTQRLSAPSGDAVCIRVSDNGPGIPKAIKEKILEPFFTTKPTGSGTGLGLSLSYDIVTQGHGGTFSVESEEGQGAVFVVQLPL